MIRTILFAVLFAKCVPAIGQGAAIQLTKMNVVYCDVENPLTIAAKNIPRQNLVLATDNGTIDTLWGERFVYRPARTGRAVVRVSENVGGKLRLIDSVVYRAKNIAPPVAWLGGVYEGTESAASIRIQYGLTFTKECYSDDLRPVKVVSFTIAFIRDSEVLAERHLYNDEGGCWFSGDDITQQMINGVIPGDFVWIRNIMARQGNSSLMKLRDIKVLAN